MPSPKEIKGRISSVSNTKKITRTMELVSTAKSRQALNRLKALSDYMKVLEDSISVSLAELEAESDSYSEKIALLREPNISAPRQYLVITSNRGLCGPFNNNVLSSLYENLNRDTQNTSYDIDFIGNKGVKQFTFSGGKYKKFCSEINDKYTYHQIEKLAKEYTNSYIQGEISSLEVIYTKYYSTGRQRPFLSRLLPLEFDEKEKVEEKEKALFILEPSPEILIQELLPKWVSVSLNQSMLSSVTSEHIARRVAMKNATESADEMVRDLTLSYNRSRQAKITQEIAEIISGAAAVS